MSEFESVFGKGFYNYEKHLKFFQEQGHEGFEAAFFALELAEMLVIEPRWARAMSMRLGDCIEVLERQYRKNPWQSKNSLDDFLLKRIVLPPNADIVQKAEAEERRSYQGKEVILSYFWLKEEFLLKYREYQAEKKVSSADDLIGDVLELMNCRTKLERNQFIHQHQETFLSRLNSKKQVTIS